MTDLTLDRASSLVILTPLTPRASRWLREELAAPAWQWLGASLVVDARCLDDLLTLAELDGLTIN